MQFTQRQQKVNCNFQPSERTEVYPAAGVSSFAGSLPGIRVPVPPAADQVGRAGGIISRASSKRTKLFLRSYQKGMRLFVGSKQPRSKPSCCPLPVKPCLGFS